jgi:hypothetical protein
MRRVIERNPRAPLVGPESKVRMTSGEAVVPLAVDAPARSPKDLSETLCAARKNSRETVLS